MSNQLAERKQNSQQGREKSLSQKSFDEMLKSMDLTSGGQQRTGRNDRSLEQQDTTLRQTSPPARYRELYRMYQRSISGASQQ